MGARWWIVNVQFSNDSKQNRTKAFITVRTWMSECLLVKKFPSQWLHIHCDLTLLTPKLRTVQLLLRITSSLPAQFYTDNFINSFTHDFFSILFLLSTSLFSAHVSTENNLLNYDTTTCRFVYKYDEQDISTWFFTCFSVTKISSFCSYHDFWTLFMLIHQISCTYC